MYNIKDLPFQDAPADPDDLEKWAASLKLKTHSSWFFPQLLAYFGTWKPVSSNNKLDAVATLRHNLGSDNAWGIGAWRIATQLPRSKIVTNQLKQASYGTLTPLILAGLKVHQDVPYSAWSPDGIATIVGKGLGAAMSFPVPILEVDELLQLRVLGLAGKPVQSTWRLTGLSGTSLQGVPTLAATIATQIWLAHPSNRVPGYMILNCNDWDDVPAPLVDSEVLTPITSLPWL